MDYLQYRSKGAYSSIIGSEVLNLIINGLPSIQSIDLRIIYHICGFKPYYKWITFNTLIQLPKLQVHH